MKTHSTCSWHDVKSWTLGYIQWHHWADEQEKAGKKQSQCPTCGLWLYPEEMGERPTK